MSEEVSIFRLYLMRLAYLLNFVMLGLQVWPAIFNHPGAWDPFRGVAFSFWAALSVLCGLGIRYPLKMLPLLFFELLWKVMWVAAWGIPLWSTQQLTPDSELTLISNLVGVVLVPLAIPWGYVLAEYVRAPGDRWGKERSAATPVRTSASPLGAATVD